MTIYAISLPCSQWTPSPKSTRLWSFVTSYQKIGIRPAKQIYLTVINTCFSESFAVLRVYFGLRKHLVQQEYNSMFLFSQKCHKGLMDLLFVLKNSRRKQVSSDICVSRQTVCQYWSAKQLKFFIVK